MSLVGKTLNLTLLFTFCFIVSFAQSLSIDNPANTKEIDEGTLQAIEITNSGFDDTDLVDISVSYDGGVSYTILSTGSSIAELIEVPYEWDTSDPESTDVWLKAENVTTQEGEYVDSVNVTIIPLIYFSYSIDDNVIGSTIGFSWEIASSVSTDDIINISVSYDAGGTYESVESGNPFSNYGTGSYYAEFTAGGPLAEKAIVKIEDVTTGYVASSDTFAIVAPEISVYAYDASACLGSDGELEVSGLGDAVTYDLYYTKDGDEFGPESISNPSNEGAYLSGLTKGEYTNIYVEYNEIQSNVITEVISINDGSPLLSLVVDDNTSCSDANGAVVVNESLGSEATFVLYEGTDTTVVSIDSGSGTSAYTFSGYPAGIYTVVVSFVEGNCVSLETIEILDNPDAPIILGTSTVHPVTINPTSVGGTDGSIDLTDLVTGASGEYTYQWYEGGDLSSPIEGETTEAISGLSAGSYSVVVTDGTSLCESEFATYTLSDPPTISDLLVVDSTSTSADLEMTLDMDAEVYFIVTTIEVSPTAAEIASGETTDSGVVYGYGNQSTLSGGNMSVTVGSGEGNDTELAIETQYFVYLVAYNTNYSDVVSTSFTTLTTPSDVSLSTIAVDGNILYTTTTENILYEIQMDVSNGDAQMEYIYLEPSSEYIETDFDQFAFYQSVGVDDFSSAELISTTNFSTGDTGIPIGAVGVFFDSIYADGTTVFFYVTADVSADAGVSNTFGFATPIAETNFAFYNSTPTDNGLSEGNLFSIFELDEIPPTVSEDTTVTVEENTTLVQSFTSENLVTWTISGTDASNFTISADGTLEFVAEPDFENPADSDLNNIYDITLEVMDSVANVQSYIVTITVADVNDNAPVITDPGTITLDENNAAGTVVVDLEFTDADTTSTTNTWSIISGNTDVNANSEEAFAIDTDGLIYVNDSSDIDYELVTAFSLEIVLNDGANNDTLSLEVSINDIDEDVTAPVITVVDLVTNDISPLLSGTVDDTTAIIKVMVNEATYDATNNQDGSWTLAQATIADLSEGEYTVQGIAIDSMENADTATAILTIDLTVPTVTVSTLETTSSSPSLSGTVDDTTATVSIIVDGFDYSADNNGDGTWSLAEGVIATLAVGTYDVLATVTDLAGNVSTDETLDELTIQPTPPSTLESTDLDYFSFTANWSSVSDASTYLLDVSSDDLFTNYINGFEKLSIEDTFRTVDDLDFGTTYYYRVRTVVDQDTSDYSAVEAVTTLVDEGTALDSLALMSIYDALNGEEWLENNWQTESDITQWSGVTFTGTRVTTVDLSSSELKGEFPVIESGLDSLKMLNLNDNEITLISDLSHFANLDTIDVAQNRLAFNSLLVAITIPQVNYGPQKELLTEVRTLEDIGTIYTVDRTIGGTDNVYSWTKDGVEISESESSFDVSVSDYSVDGVYVASVTNPSVQGVTLTTTPVILRVSSLERDSAALMVMYDSLGGSASTLSDWPNLAIEDWTEVTITSSRVTKVDLSSKGLTGILPEDITDIEHLESIDLSGNEISGLPDLDGFLPNLTSFDVSENALTFEDLEPNVGITGIVYTDQAVFGESLSEVVPVGSEYTVEMYVGGSANNYSWTRAGVLDTLVLSGEQAASVVIPTLSYETMGEYTVEVTNDLVPGLTLTSKPIEVLASANLFFSAVDSDDFPFTSGTGYALQFTEVGHPYDTIKTAAIINEGYLFEGLILGDYLISIDPDNLDEFLPTYFESTDLWTEADTFLLRNDQDDTLSMAQIIDLTVSGGAKVSGTVETNFASESDSRVEARRKVQRAGCSVRRFVAKGRVDDDDEEGEYELYAYVQSDDEGRFEFNGLEDGKYRFNIEYPGIPMDEDSYVEFVIGEGGIEDEELILEATITEDGIYVEKVEQLGFYENYFSDLTVYPNPANQYVRIGYTKLKSSTVVMQLINLQGTLVSEQVIGEGTEQELSFDVSSISEGIYLLNFVDSSQDSKKITSYKVYVSH